MKPQPGPFAPYLRRNLRWLVGVGLITLGRPAAAEQPTRAAAVSGDVFWIVGLAVGCLLLLASTDWLVSRVRRALRRHARDHEQPGVSPLRPLTVDSYDEVFRRRVATCDCGGQPKVAFEGATRSKSGKLWLMIEICPRCQQRFQTYFDVTSAEDDRPLKGNPPVTPVPR